MAAPRPRRGAGGLFDKAFCQGETRQVRICRVGKAKRAHHLTDEIGSLCLNTVEPNSRAASSFSRSFLPNGRVIYLWSKWIVSGKSIELPKSAGRLTQSRSVSCRIIFMRFGRCRKMILISRHAGV